MYYPEILVRGRDICLVEISRRTKYDNTWEYYFAGSDKNIKPIIIPIGSPIIVGSNESPNTDMIKSNLEVYLDQAGIGDELYGYEPIRLGFVRGFNLNSEITYSTQSCKATHPLNIMAPYQFYIVKNSKKQLKRL